MPGGVQGLQGEAAHLDGLPVGEAGVGEAAGADRGGQHGGALNLGEFGDAGDEVCVQVGFHRVGDAQSAPGGLGAYLSQVAFRVHNEGAAVAEVKQIGGVAQSLVYDGDQIQGAHDSQSFHTG